MDNTPRVTVLMTVFNGGRYLKTAVESVLAQTWRDFEFLIVDDASTDASLETISFYHDPRIRVITNARNLGQTASLNVGLKVAKAEFVARIDADDRVYPLWLEEQLHFMDRHPPCAVASMRAVLMDSQEKIMKELNTPASSSEIVLKSVFASPINHVGCLMRRDAVLAAGAYDERYRIVADYDLWCRLLRKGQTILTNPKILAAVRGHAQSVSMMEADKRVMPEMTEIIVRNSGFWSAVSLTQEEALLLWNLVYSAHTLESPEFRHALEIFKDIYRTWKPAGFPPAMIKGFCRRQIKIIFVKRILGLIKQSRLGPARECACAYMKQHGRGNIFAMIWCLTFFGRVSQRAADVYEYLLALRAGRKVNALNF